MNQPPWGAPPTTHDQYAQGLVPAQGYGPPPGWGPALMAPQAWACGDILVLPTMGCSMPPICPKTGEPTQDGLTVKLQWQPQWVYLLLMLGVLPFAIASLATQKRAVIRFPMSQRIIARRRNGFIVGGAGFVAFLLLLIVGASQDIAAFAILSPFVFIGSLIYMVVTVNLFKVAKITDQYALLRNVHPAFLQHFSQGPLPVQL